jgi:predicted metal-dependent hydrolase
MVKGFALRWLPKSRPESIAPLILDGVEVPVLCRRNALAKRYRLFIDRSGRPRITIPRRGNAAEARSFAETHRGWLAEQLAKFRGRQLSQQHWCDGTLVWFRGQHIPLELLQNETSRVARLGSQEIPLPDSEVAGDPGLRRAIETHLRRLAARELPVCVHELAALHGCVVLRVSVRNQRTRWGSCSRKGAISLNWRLVQVPGPVRDYVILHELMHLREMNHSPRYWAQVAAVCPDYAESEAWLRANSGLLASMN